MTITELGALRIARPDEFKARLKKAMREADGAVEDAAEALGVSARTLKRWLADMPDVPRRSEGRPAKK